MSAQPTLQLADNQPTIAQQLPTTTLPQVFSDVKRAYKGFRVFAEGKWTFYATSCLSSEEVADLEEWLDDPTPVRKAA